MLDQRAFLKVQEGSFVFLLPADRARSIERRQATVFEAIDGAGPVLCARYVGGDERVPVIRLAGLLGVPAGQWAYAILFTGESGHVAVAAEHIHVIVETQKPVVQPFNPVGVAVEGEPVITGVCPGTEPEHLVLDPARLQRCLHRAVRRAGAG